MFMLTVIVWYSSLRQGVWWNPFVYSASRLWFPVAHHTFTSAQFRHQEKPQPSWKPPQASWGPIQTCRGMRFPKPGRLPLLLCSPRPLQRIPSALCLSGGPASSSLSSDTSLVASEKWGEAGGIGVAHIWSTRMSLCVFLFAQCTSETLGVKTLIST